jgi:hypothetical protein
MEFTAKEKAIVDQLRVWHNQISERLGKCVAKVRALAEIILAHRGLT